MQEKMPVATVVFGNLKKENGTTRRMTTARSWWKEVVHVVHLLINEVGASAAAVVAAASSASSSSYAAVFLVGSYATRRIGRRRIGGTMEHRRPAALDDLVDVRCSLQTTRRGLHQSPPTTTRGARTMSTSSVLLYTNLPRDFGIVVIRRRLVLRRCVNGNGFGDSSSSSKNLMVMDDEERSVE